MNIAANTGGSNSPRIVPRHSELNIEKIRRVKNAYNKNNNFNNLGILSVTNHDHQQYHSVTRRSNYQNAKNQHQL